MFAHLLCAPSQSVVAFGFASPRLASLRFVALPVPSTFITQLQVHVHVHAGACCYPLYLLVI